MTQRDRVCAAIIKKGLILMVRIEDGINNFWTLPGGGIEQGETHEEAVLREVKEEVCLNIVVRSFLFNYGYSAGECYCYLCEEDGTDQVAQLGFDPELDKDNQVLKKIEWIPINEMKEDLQVSRVIKALSLA
jgi:8-oxo-dGTP diphosphatase